MPARGLEHLLADRGLEHHEGEQILQARPQATVRRSIARRAFDST